jgi:hypothetical protein
MSKIDEARLIDAMIAIAEYWRQQSEVCLKAQKRMTDIITEFQTVEVGTLNAPTPEPKPTGKWIPAQGAKGPFEMLKDKDTVEYRELKNDLDYADHPLSKKFADGKVYSFWLMQDNETIGRRLKP